MEFFDFSEQVRRAWLEAKTDVERWAVKTSVGRAEFPSAVRSAGFQLLESGGSFEPDRDLVVGAAPWSGPDLAILNHLSSRPLVRKCRVTVFDIDALAYSEMVRLIPGIKRFTNTPVVLFYDKGELIYSATGRDAELWLREF